MRVHFDKPYRTISENLDELERRGLTLGDRAYAVRCLERIGYYRLSAYWYPFRLAPEDGYGSERSNAFREGTSFEEVLQFYLFDKELRLRLNDALERIEIAIRAFLVDGIGEMGTLAYRDPRTHNSRFTDLDEIGNTQLDSFLKGLDENFTRSKEEFSKHFRRKYSGHPPV